MYSFPIINTMLQKTIQIQLTNPYLAITNDEQHYGWPIELDIMKCLVSKSHFCSLSGDLYPLKCKNYCVLAVYSTSIKISKLIAQFWSRNSITQLSLHHNLMAVIQNSTIECRCHGYTDKRNIPPQQ